MIASYLSIEDDTASDIGGRNPCVKGIAMDVVRHNTTREIDAAHVITGVTG